MEDASLDDFLDGGEDDGGPAEANDGPAGDERTDADGQADPSGGEGDPDRSRAADGERGGTDAVDPATATYAWTPGGEPCAACGERVERRWRSAAGLVCPDCVEW